jgi:leucyl aminopeptidase (aminopeptidase T)
MPTDRIHSDFDIETLADKAVEMLSISAGHVIWIWASTYSLDLIEALAYRIRERGAFWAVRLTMESLLQRIGQGVPEPYLGLIPNHELCWLTDVNAIISVQDHRWHPQDVPLARRRAMGAEWRALIDNANRRGIRIIKTINPTPALASAYGMPLASLRQACWQAVNIDYKALDRQQGTVGARLAETKQVHISSALGTDLRLRIINARFT